MATQQDRYGISLDQMSQVGANAANAADRTRARTFIYRDKTPIAALVSLEDFGRLEPPDPGAMGGDPLLSLCGACAEDAFVDSFSDLSKTRLFQR